MDQIKKSIVYLKDPQLVADFQNKLGIQPRRNSTREQSRKLDVDCESNSSRKKTVPKCDKTKCSEDEANTSDDPPDQENTMYKIEHHGDSKNYTVKNKFLYYFFYVGTYLGDEIFYSIYFPFWFWNVDYNVGRRIITVWAVVMYIGQSIKDVIKWPRPTCPPAVRVQSKWSLEYGMPSTHAMIAVAIPTASILFSYDKYNYPVPLAVMVAVAVCLWVCTSRIYLGMHTVLDVLAGVLLSIVLVAVTVPIIRNFDSTTVAWRGTPLVFFIVTLSLVIFYPKCEQWTPTRGDTATVLGCISGIYLGAYVVYENLQQQNQLSVPVITVEYLTNYPQLQRAGILLVRFVLGILVIIMLEILLSLVSYSVDRCLGLDPKEDRIQRKQRLPALDLTYKYITYIILGFAVATLPLVITVGFNINSLL
uniref:Sphingosine-1-phosphate phosphatase 1 n=1 Tax=Cacopsylla melanoneura TaxID=428564 RepID=A0A8D9FBS1_9HEMI